MYQAHWGLRESPFRGSLDTKFFHQSPTHEEALARMQFLLDQRRRLGLLAAPSGCGKSLLLEVFAANLRRTARPVAKLSLLGVEPAEMLALLAAGWGLSLSPTAPLPVLWRAIADRITEYRYQQIDAVALLDDADQADRLVLQHVARLVRFDPRPETRLCVVLAARTENVQRLGQSLLDLVDLRINIDPWEPADTADFINSSLVKAGRKTPAFDDSALSTLHELSHGIPRRTAQLADLALIAAASANLPQVDSEVVQSVCTELVAV